MGRGFVDFAEVEGCMICGGEREEVGCWCGIMSISGPDL